MTILDIVFQSGDFYNQSNSFWSTFFLNIISALIGSGSAIWIFYSSTKRDREHERVRRSELMDEKFNYFTVLLTGIIAFSKEQSKAIEEFVEKLNSNPTEFPLIRLLPMNDLKRIAEKINQEEYYYAYLNKFGNTKKDVEAFKKLYSILDYLNIQYPSNYDMIDKSQQFDYQRKLNFKELFEKIMEEIYLYSNSPAAALNQALVQFLNQNINSYFDNRRNENKDMEYAYNAFITPVKLGIVQGFNNIDVAVRLASKLKHASDIYRDIIDQNSKVVEDFKEINTKIKEANAELERLSKPIIDSFK